MAYKQLIADIPFADLLLWYIMTALRSAAANPLNRKIGGSDMQMKHCNPKSRLSGRFEEFLLGRVRKHRLRHKAPLGVNASLPALGSHAASLVRRLRRRILQFIALDDIRIDEISLNPRLQYGFIKGRLAGPVGARNQE